MSEPQPGRRLFLGVRVSVACANTLAAAAETLARRARDGGITVAWAPPASYHVTLKFLGWTREDAIGAVRDAVGTAVAGLPDLKFRASRLGAFASIERATVLWAGVESPGAAALTELAQRCETATVALGYAASTQPYVPHITLGRLREPRPVRELILPVSEQMFSETRSDGLILYESQAISSGSSYREIARIPFQQASDPRFRAPERQTRPVQLDTPNAAVSRSTAASLDSPDAPETDDGWPRGQGP